MMRCRFGAAGAKFAGAMPAHRAAPFRINR
jgi:hypothetical protein